MERNSCFEGGRLSERRKEILSCGGEGWSGVFKFANEKNSFTVVGYKHMFRRVPFEFQNGRAGSAEERSYAQEISAVDIFYY